MAREEVVKIAWEADISKLVTAMAKQKGLNEKQTKQLLKELKKRETAAGRIAKRISDKEKRESAKGLRAIRQATKDKIESFKKFGEAAQGSIGATTGRVFALGEGMVKFAAASGPIGLATLAVAAFAAVATLGFVAATAAAVGLVLKADDLNKEIEKFNRVGGFKDAISPEQKEAIEKFNDQMRLVGVVIKQIAVAVAGELAPYLAKAGDLLLRLGLLARDAFTGWSKSNDLVSVGLTKIIKHLVRLLTGPVGAIQYLGETIVMMHEALGITNPVIEKMGDALKYVDDTIEGFIKRGVDAHFEDLGRVVGYAASSLSKYDKEIASLYKVIAREKNGGAVDKQAKQLEELTKRLGGVARATGGLISSFTGFQQKAKDGLATPVQKIQIQLERDLKAFGKARGALEEQRKRLEQSIEIGERFGVDTGLLGEQLAQTLGKLQQFEDSRVQLIAGASAQIKAIRDVEAKQQQQQQQAAIAAVFKSMDALGKFAAMQAKNAKDGTKAQKQAAMASFVISRASAIAQITMATAKAIMESLTILPPFGPIQAAAVGVTGAVQLATVMSTPPPTFHTGGGIGSSGVAPDEVTIRAKSGEGVLSAQGMAAIGGRAGLNGLNRGGSGPELVVVQKYQHRAFGSFIQDDVRMVNSPLRRAIKGQKKVGHKG